MLDPNPESRSQTERVADAIRQRIAARKLGPGDRLPSIRAMAGAMSVSASTVVEAYDRLSADGEIRARRGSGFYVSQTALPPLSLIEGVTRHERAIDPVWVSRQSLGTGPDILKPGCGWLPDDWMPTDSIRKALRGLARADGAMLTNYGGTHGSLALRRMVFGKLAEDGIDASPEQVLLTGSGTQSIDLVCRLLLRPGDTVLVDDPCYFNFRALLRAHQARIVSVPMTPTGPDSAVFEAVLSAEKPKLYVTNSALHNPTGATLSAQTAYRLLVAAAAHGLTIVEDDIFAEFEPEPSVRMAALDGLQRVIRIGSFSKTISASVRCGYIAARADWIEELVNLQIASNFGGPSPLASELVAAVLGGGGHRKHMDELRRKLMRAQVSTIERLGEIGIEPWMIPRGGFNLWCRLPNDVDSAAVAQAALADGVVLAPGNVYSASSAAANYMRINVAQCGDARLMPILKRAITSATQAAT
jgi:DNA-binding transcriptional MocR family regulator